MLSQLFNNVHIIDLSKMENEYNTRKGRKTADQNEPSNNISVWDIRLAVIKEAIKCLTYEVDVIGPKASIFESKSQLNLREIKAEIEARRVGRNEKINWKYLYTKFNLSRKSPEELKKIQELCVQTGVLKSRSQEYLESRLSALSNNENQNSEK
jgi:hypothetical protein